MSTSQSRLIAKMQKLLAMANGNANEHEAMIAAKQLHSMLAKHNMSMTDLDEKEDVGQCGEATRNQAWRRYIAYNIAKLYFCDMYVSKCGDRKAYFMFVGTEANRTFANEIFKMVVKTINSEANKSSREVYGNKNATYIRSFWNGAQVRISQRCKELIRDAKMGTLKDEEGNTMPVLLDQYDKNAMIVKEFTDSNLNLKASKGRATSSKDYLGFNKGVEAGGKVQLSRAIQSKSAPKMLS